ncbi:MAG: glutaredoxin family protein [Mariprofundaceae bacterium]|nr:glutaredoxin family protein [Mariprofundaceae bacterium]
MAQAKPRPAHLQLMSRRQCCLCDEAKDVVEQAAAQGLCTWEVVDVDCDKALLVRYGNDVPVLLINGEKRFQHRVDFSELHAVLEDAPC